MRKSRFTKGQIVALLKEGEARLPSPRSCGSTASAGTPTSTGRRGTPAPVRIGPPKAGPPDSRTTED